jgi:hypothetical protein
LEIGKIHKHASVIHKIHFLFCFFFHNDINYFLITQQLIYLCYQFLIDGFYFLPLSHRRAHESLGVNVSESLKVRVGSKETWFSNIVWLYHRYCTEHFECVIMIYLQSIFVIRCNLVCTVLFPICYKKGWKKKFK